MLLVVEVNIQCQKITQPNIYHPKISVLFIILASSTKDSHRQFDSQLVQQEPVEILTMYGQAESTQVDRSISLGTTSLPDFTYVYCKRLL